MIFSRNEEELKSRHSTSVSVFFKSEYPCSLIHGRVHFSIFLWAVEHEIFPECSIVGTRPKVRCVALHTDAFQRRTGVLSAHVPSDRHLHPARLSA